MDFVDLPPNIGELAQQQQQVKTAMYTMESNQPAWSKADAHWVIPGPFLTDKSFYFCVFTGECIFAAADDLLTESDVYQNWALVEHADALEVEGFILHDVFQAVHVNSIHEGNVIDMTWVRRWKHVFANGQWKSIIKSRLCGRGFLDSQKHLVQRHSSTASRLSQKIILSLKQQHDWELES